MRADGAIAVVNGAERHFYRQTFIGQQFHQFSPRDLFYQSYNLKDMQCRYRSGKVVLTFPRFNLEGRNPTFNLMWAAHRYRLLWRY